MTTLSANPSLPRGPGRLPLDADPARRARNLRYLIGSTLGYSAAAIAAGEPTPVHPRTVRRGIAAARDDVAQKLAAASFDFSPGLGRALDLKNAVTRRRTDRNRTKEN